jgi:two-component system sensor histidine kinase CiaH
MEEKKFVKKQLIKNMVYTFAVFTILVLVFDVLIYKRAEQLLYKEIDTELQNFANKNWNNKIIVLSPRIIYIIRDLKGNIINEENIGRVYEYISDVEFDKNKINTIYSIKLNSEYNYRGITTVAYSTANELRYVQLLANVDGENESLINLRHRLFRLSTIIIITSIIASYILSRKTLKPIFQAWEKQTEFVQNAAHELRTPLTIIQAKQQLLLKEPESRIIDKSEDISLTINETRRLTKLVKELMILATADSNQLEVKKELKNIDDVVKEVASPYIEYAQMQNKKLELELNCNKEVNIDLSKITELLIILLDNAIKYTKEGENIKVITHCKDGKATIEVADEGIGISDEQKKHLFERFYRADKARTRETGGTGLGLAIAQTIVKAHGGTIKVYNNTPKGTKFVVKI